MLPKFSRPSFILYFLTVFLLFQNLPSQAQFTDTTRVAIHEVGNYFEMENGWLGVRIPMSTLFDPAFPDFTPAPMRVLRFQDGSFANDYPNYLRPPTPALSMSSEVLLDSDDTCRIEVGYTFQKPDLFGPNGLLEAAGPGYYKVVFTMIKGEKACLVTEESNYEINWEMKTSDGIAPDRARYEGNHATSIANGYDKNGNIYERTNTAGWQATVDFQFEQRKEYELLARWNPFVINSGWHWQLYNSTNGTAGYLFGIFDGRPSKLLGAEASGVGIYTEPAAINDLHAACDDLGNCHYVWVTEDELWHKKIAANGTASPEEVIAFNLIRPFVFVANGVVNILAIDPEAPDGQQIRFFKNTNGSNFQPYTLNLDTQLEDLFAWGASNGTHDFVMVKGKHNGQSGLQLYASELNPSNFAWRDVLTHGSSTREANRPDLKKAPNGDIVVAYCADNTYQSYNLILKDSLRFDMVGFQPFGGESTFGMAVDPCKGDFFWVNQSGNIRYIDLEGSTVAADYVTNVNAPVNHSGAELPNRRSFAIGDGGNGLAFHGNRFYWFDNTSHAWSEMTGTGWEGILPAHINFNPTTHLYYIVGKYNGRLTRLSYNGSGAPVFLDNFQLTERKAAGVRSIHKRIAPTGQYYPKIRFEWGLFAASKSAEDFPPVDSIQTIARAMNRLSGLANRLESFKNQPLDFNAAFGTGSIYLPTADLQATIQKVATDPAFYDQMAGIDPQFKDVLDAWRDPSNVATSPVYQAIVDYGNNVAYQLKHGGGIYTPALQYTNGGNEMRRWSTKIAGLMADNKLTASQRQTLESYARMFARILWDDDFVPLFTEHGLGFGTASNAQSYTGQRWFFALLASSDPEFTQRTLEIPTKLQTVLDADINAAGAPIGTPHYLQPPMETVAFTALQLKNAGIQDKFSSSDTLRLFSDFCLHLLTPPNVRFGQNRKLICFGDGSEESAAIFGLMATGFAGHDDELANRLISAYRNGPPRGSDFGFISMAINQNLPETTDLGLQSGNFPGYLSALRSGIGTERESGLWFINGDHYSDHRNDDRGALAVYALGAPLSLNYGSFYSPHAPGAMMKSTPVPLADFPEWAQANQPVQLPGNETWHDSQQTGYLFFKNSARASAVFSKNQQHWTRETYSLHPRSETPVFVIYDHFDDAADYIWSFNFMAKGAVQTPGGSVTPPPATWNYLGGPYQFPSASPPIAIAPGLNRFDFKGIEWPSHPTNGIDWEAYVETDGAASANLSEWAHTFIPTVEKDEFQAANGTSYEERQTLLRVKGKDHFYTVIVPYWKGQRPGNLQVSKSGDQLSVTADSFSLQAGLRWLSYEDAQKKVLSTFGNELHTYDSYTLEGGPMELEIHPDTIFARLNGPTGQRKVTFPTGSVWVLAQPSPDAVFDSTEGKWALNFTSSGPVHNAWTGHYAEFVFLKGMPSGSTEKGRPQHSVRIFPNPAKGTATLEVFAKKKGPVKVDVFDSSGAALQRAVYEAKKGKNLFDIHLAGLPSGVCVFKVTVDGKEETEKVVIGGR